MSVAALRALVDELPDELRAQALTHASWTEARVDSYERLAFLGDAVLGLAVASGIYSDFGEIEVGGLTKIHNHAVSGVACTEVGRELGVAGMLADAEPDRDDAIPAKLLLAGSRPLPEVTEALIGACFVAFGFERTAAAVAEAFAARAELAAETTIDFKSELQEALARRGLRVEYSVTGESGPAHRREFEVEAVVAGESLGSGAGRSKKAAEQVAAEQALKRLGG